MPVIHIKHIVQQGVFLIACRTGKDVALAHILYQISCLLYITAVRLKCNQYYALGHWVSILCKLYEVIGTIAVGLSMWYFSGMVFFSNRLNIYDMYRYTILWMVLLYDKGWVEKLKDEIGEYVHYKVECLRARNSHNTR